MCLSCEKNEIERLQEEVKDEKELKERMKKAKIPRYIGESSRSAYERGWEHLDKLATLNSSSHMLRHMVLEHKGEDFGEVQWGMFVKKFLRSAFERQIEEAVEIEKESKSGRTLNSKAEYNNCTIPRLTTRAGNPMDEMKQVEKEIKAEKEKGEKIEKIEKEIRDLRKKEKYKLCCAGVKLLVELS